MSKKCKGEGVNCTLCRALEEALEIYENTGDALAFVRIGITLMQNIKCPLTGKGEKRRERE